MFKKIAVFTPLLIACLVAVANAQTPGPGNYGLNDTLNGTNGGGDATVHDTTVPTATVSYTTDGGQNETIVTLAYEGENDLGVSIWSNGDDAGSTRWEVLEVDGVCYYWIKKKGRNGKWKTVSSGTLKKKKKKADVDPIDSIG